jgi:hypothetical protein
VNNKGEEIILNRGKRNSAKHSNKRNNNNESQLVENTNPMLETLRRAVFPLSDIDQGQRGEVMDR